MVQDEVSETRNRILDEDVLAHITNATDEFEMGHIEETCQVLEDPNFDISRLTPSIAVLLLRQKAGYYFITGEKEKCFKVLVDLGELNRNTGEYEEAIKSFSTARTLEPEDINLKYKIAESIVMSGDIPVGFAKLKSIIEEKPDLDVAVTLLLKCAKRYRPESVVDLIPDHLSRNPEDTSAYRYAIDIYEKLEMKTKAISVREKLVELLEKDDGLDSFVSECARIYPGHKHFSEKKLELAIDSSNYDEAFKMLKHLVSLAERHDKLEDALTYTEMMLLIDLSSTHLMDKADEIRHSLGYKQTPLRCNPLPEGAPVQSDQSKLLKLNFAHIINNVSGLINQYLHENIELSKGLRSSLLEKTRLRSMINAEFEGSSSTPTELWAKLQSAENSTEKLADLFWQHPDSKPVLKALLNSYNDDNERVMLWIEIAEQAQKDGKKERIFSILSLLTSACDSLAEFINRLNPLLKESY